MSEERDAHVDALADDLTGALCVHTSAEVVAAKAHRRNDEPGVAEVAIFHVASAFLRSCHLSVFSGQHERAEAKDRL
jgi:hypothetical protein